uniref:Uncharacterized protein n=1 Tax=Physcomitrium patens TaxID=3218 RepID=A0A2K1IF86_PHYPA|nr:hypothetical protein PHYPA_028527 [Physcomitrium patens]
MNTQSYPFQVELTAIFVHGIHVRIDSILSRFTCMAKQLFCRCIPPLSNRFFFHGIRTVYWTSSNSAPSVVLTKTEIVA